MVPFRKTGRERKNPASSPGLLRLQTLPHPTSKPVSKQVPSSSRSLAVPSPLERPVPRGAQSARSLGTPEACPPRGDGGCVRREAGWEGPRAAPHPGPGPGSSHPGSLATFPMESPKGSECGYPRALDLLCRERLGAAGPAGSAVWRRSLSGEGRAEKMRSPASARRRPPARPTSSPLSPPTLEPALGREADALALGATGSMGAAASTRPAGVSGHSGGVGERRAEGGNPERCSEESPRVPAHSSGRPRCLPVRRSRAETSDAGASQWGAAHKPRCLAHNG